MAQFITFTATDSADFTVSIWNYSGETKLADIPLDVAFDISPYGGDPNAPWIPAPPNEYRIYPVNESQIISVATTPTNYTPRFYDEVGYWRGFPISSSYYTGAIAVSVTAQEGGGVVVASPYNRVYKVDSETIGEFSHIVAQAPGDNINYTDYVIQLLSIPFEIPSEFVSVEAPITLGPLVTDVTAPTLSTDLMRISLGDIVVGGLYGNSLDYYAAQYTLVLPYVAMEISLDPHCVVGETVSVQYVLDAYTGDVTVNVFSTSQDDPIHTSKTSVGRTIPFKTYGNTTEGTVGAIQGADNGVVAAYIRADRKVTASGQFSNMVTVERDLEGLEGFVSVENLDIQCSATYDELQTITDRLRGGVIIK